MRDLLLFVHIVGVAGWIGGGLFGMYAAGRLAGEGGASNGRAMETLFAKAGIYFTIMFLLVVGSGVALVMTQDQWGWTDTFIWIGIGAIVLSGIWQGVYASKADVKLVESVKGEALDRQRVLAGWRRTAWVDVGILLIAVWAMVSKIGV